MTTNQPQVLPTRGAPARFECDTRSSFSFFKLVDLWPWMGDRQAQPLLRLGTLMRKMKASAGCLEDVTDTPAVQEEISSAAVALGMADAGSTGHRLAFFDHLANLLAYADVVSLRFGKRWTSAYVLEAVMVPPKLPKAAVDVPNYYVHCQRMHNVDVDGHTYGLTGSFFAQQNGLTHVCAHAALRTAINSSSQWNRAPLSNKQINDILGIDHIKSGFPNSKAKTKLEGLYPSQIKTVAQHFGGDARIAEFGAGSKTEYDAFAYPYIESGWPVLLGLGTQSTDHAVTLLGHTLNTDRWMPFANREYGTSLASSAVGTLAWVDHFIGADDHFGMLATLPTESLRKQHSLPVVSAGSPDQPGKEPPVAATIRPSVHVKNAIALMPIAVEVDGAWAEMCAIAAFKACLRSDSRPTWQMTGSDEAAEWLVRLQRASGSGHVMYRTQLVTRERYLKHLDQIVLDAVYWDRIRAAIAKRLPTHTWLTEVTTPEIYGGLRHKLGDCVVPAASREQANKGPCFVWLPGRAFSARVVESHDAWPIESHRKLLASDSDAEHW